MAALSDTFRTLRSLRRALRQVADDHGLPLEVRARLVLSISGVAGHELRAGRTVRLGSARQPGSGGQPTLLSVSLVSPASRSPLPLAGLPFAAQAVDDTTVTWHVPVPEGAKPPPDARTPGVVRGSENEELERELRA